MAENSTFRDWIPEGEDTGAIGVNGFQDFVPAPQPKLQAVEEQIQQEIAEETVVEDTGAGGKEGFVDTEPLPVPPTEEKPKKGK